MKTYFHTLIKTLIDYCYKNTLISSGIASYLTAKPIVAILTLKSSPHNRLQKQAPPPPGFIISWPLSIIYIYFYCIPKTISNPKTEKSWIGLTMTNLQIALECLGLLKL
jgi:hypothetical protein